MEEADAVGAGEAEASAGTEVEASPEVEALRRAVAAVDSVELREFDSEDPIAVTALVTLSTPGHDPTDQGEETWWLVPSAGGFELDADGVRIKTLTPTSPLGHALLGLVSGDEGTFKTPRGKREFEVLRVS